MKRILLTAVLLTTFLGARAQKDSLQWQEQSESHLGLDLGLSAGVTLFSTDNQYSPYYSTHGLTLQVPLLLRYQVSPHWRLATGLRFDVNYNPLHYNVDQHWVDDGNGYRYVDGLAFGNYASGRDEGKQHAYTLFGYFGIPLQATWYPWSREHRLLGVTADLYAGYAFVSNLGLNASYADRSVSGSVGLNEVEHVKTQDDSLLPWKLELGITLSTDVLGLLHGVRFFANLLPSYRDPLSGEGLYLHGVTFFL